MPEYYTTEQAAKTLGVTSSRIRQLIGEGRLKSQKHGRDHLIQACDLYEFKKTGKKKRGRPNKNILRKR